MDGRVVYNRKKHEFRLSDVERILRTLPLPDSDIDKERFEALLQTIMFRYYLCRSYSQAAKLQGYQPAKYHPDWFQKWFLKKILDISAAMVYSQGIEGKFYTAVGD